ncbi:GNAT family N-acetyltransferase [Planomicrobium sp. Y74]|uniref:GNAT family N-acetyltransferase n=1 Tax=Planomicrobium sp. Y74 TaxID=2478977 RepID=UPI000EF484A5|nr:GNAT family N-acetyltransferase [Planomicrobium sp. Y74]RLQ89806.1 GNAT family N-acetyltransferase [Planomicrobium sp. Y74]
MRITLQEATESDAAAIHELQLAAFAPLLKKYRDYGTSPATEPLEKTVSRIKHTNSHYYMILADKELVGALHVVRKETNGSLWISPVFIGTAHQGKGIAQTAMLMAEERFADDKVWELSTLAEEKGNCHLYEKLGYQRTGKIQKINEQATLVYYKKELS